VDRAVDAATAQEEGIGRVDDAIDVFFHDVALDDLQPPKDSLVHGAVEPD
jgi:hypothetical protein